MTNAMQTDRDWEGTVMRRAHAVPRCRQRRRAMLAILAVAVLGGTGCSLDGLLNGDELPKDVSDPALTDTPTGARNAYNGTLAQFRGAFGGSGGADPSVSVVAMTALLTDELLDAGAGSVDRRFLPERTGAMTDITYSELQKVRGQATQAIGLAGRHLPDQPAFLGHLYAMQGYAEIFLAELFCSGIPLSTIDFGGDFTYHAGSTTAEVFGHAVALFDTALEFAGDSARIADMARIGRARALLGLGRYAEAADGLAGIASDYRYNVTYNKVSVGTASAQNFARIAGVFSSSIWDFTVPDQEGGNGLAWRAAEDPRVPVEVRGAIYPEGLPVTMYYPSAYAPDGSTPLGLASGVEARLIEAEAALQVGTGTWLTMLNALRTDGNFDVRYGSISSSVSARSGSFSPAIGKGICGASSASTGGGRMKSIPLVPILLGPSVGRLPPMGMR